MEDKKSKKKKIASILLKRLLKPHNFIPLVFILVSGSYAWFMFNTAVKTSVDITVRSWDIIFSTDETTVSDTVVFTVADLYPGMKDQHFTAYISNNGIATADVKYSITSARILNDNHAEEEGVETTEDITEMLKTEYPFIIDIGITQDVLEPGAKATFFIDCNWDYEQPEGSDFTDEDDTYWGMAAYDYGKTHPDSKCIEISVQIDVVQRDDASAQSEDNE